jgi:lactate dehydrogenase-like 2-hydroxyacid dehydrogenase
MTIVDTLKMQRNSAIAATRSGPPARTSNQFFGVGPITDAVADEVEARRSRYEFEHWFELNYRKLDDNGRDIGPFTVAEVSRSMHRGYPADKIIIDMMREIHGYFDFPKSNRMAIGLGGGHSGFTVSMLHLISAGDDKQQIYIDTPRPESTDALLGGFFRQSWGAQIVELMRATKGGNEQRLHFAATEGALPTANELVSKGVRLIVGVGHETTGATTYTETEIQNLLAWIAIDPENNHAILDATSLLGAMPWSAEIVREVTAKCCFFMPFQKAIGGISGYFVISFTPQALALVERNAKNPIAAIPRQMKLATPLDQKMPISGERTVNLGPFFDPVTDKMLGGVINTFSTLALAETTFGLKRAAARVGTVGDMNRRSTENRDAINTWLLTNTLLVAGVGDAQRRGAAVTLLKIVDPDIKDIAIHRRIIGRSKQLLAYDGITHPNGDHEQGLDVARYINAFPGTDGDYRAWIGGIRDTRDIIALLENLRYAYLRAKIVVLEEELEKMGVRYVEEKQVHSEIRLDDKERVYKVLIADLIGLKFGKSGQPDPSEVKAYIISKGCQFHMGAIAAQKKYASGIHFFYQPDLSTEAEILEQSGGEEFDAVIAAATHLPNNALFPLGGVRIGAGTGNMKCVCWGGGDGQGGSAPLMNTPSFNSRATAQMAMKALLKVMPDLAVDELHKRTVAGKFDTSKHLRNYPTEKLEGKTIAILGYGNIGRELAKIASAFGMKVQIHARPRHKTWIESEGFTYAPHAEDAASGADVISIHTGLGGLDPKSGKYSNVGFINTSILNKLNHGAVLLNYDRGECVDVKALDKAMKSGRVRYAAIDADIFVTGKKITGPLALYLPLAKKYVSRLELLPHVAADTEHVSRVEAAKQAIDQILDCIRFMRVTNLKGTLPEGYTNAGSKTVVGVGRAGEAELKAAALDQTVMEKLRSNAEDVAAIIAALSSTSQPELLDVQIKRHGASLVKAANTVTMMLRKLGLEGPYDSEA